MATIAEFTAPLRAEGSSKAVRSWVLPVSALQNRAITTIEGIRDRGGRGNFRALST
jgi:aerobic-type carbon monoxide dehydrogenase small subunit (CoxS/CutS family)